MLPPRGVPEGLVSALALALQGALLVQHAPTAVADGFVASRLGEGSHGLLFGELPTGVNAAAIAERA